MFRNPNLVNPSCYASRDSSWLTAGCEGKQVCPIADLAAYCVNWGLQFKGMTEPTCSEIEPLARMVYEMKFIGKCFDENQQERPLYGIFYVDDLRPKRGRVVEAE